MFYSELVSFAYRRRHDLASKFAVWLSRAIECSPTGALQFSFSFRFRGPSV